MKFLVKKRFSILAIADVRGVSLPTVERRLNKFSLSSRSVYSTMSDEDLDTDLSSISIAVAAFILETHNLVLFV